MGATNLEVSLKLTFEPFAPQRTKYLSEASAWDIRPAISERGAEDGGGLRQPLLMRSASIASLKPT